MYNRNNFRDIYVNKPKEMTRAEYYYSLQNKPNENLIKYQSSKAKKLLRIFNDIFNNGEILGCIYQHIYRLAFT